MTSPTSPGDSKVTYTLKKVEWETGWEGGGLGVSITGSLGQGCIWMVKGCSHYHSA